MGSNRIVNKMCKNKIYIVKIVLYSTSFLQEAVPEHKCFGVADSDMDWNKKNVPTERI
jgi:hypothetical protein